MFAYWLWQVSSGACITRANCLSSHINIYSVHTSEAFCLHAFSLLSRYKSQHFQKHGKKYTLTFWQDLNKGEREKIERIELNKSSENWNRNRQRHCIVFCVVNSRWNAHKKRTENTRTNIKKWHSIFNGGIISSRNYGLFEYFTLTGLTYFLLQCQREMLPLLYVKPCPQSIEHTFCKLVFSKIVIFLRTYQFYEYNNSNEIFLTLRAQNSKEWTMMKIWKCLRIGWRPHLIEMHEWYTYF